MAGRRYAADMREKLQDLRQHITDAVHLKGIKRARILQPNLLLENKDDNYLRDEAIWGDDPVHMTTRGYTELARNLEAVIEEMKEEDEKEEKAALGTGREKAPLPSVLRGRDGTQRLAAAEAGSSLLCPTEEEVAVATPATLKAVVAIEATLEAVLGTEAQAVTMEVTPAEAEAAVGTVCTTAPKTAGTAEAARGKCVFTSEYSNEQRRGDQISHHHLYI